MYETNDPNGASDGSAPSDPTPYAQPVPQPAPAADPRLHAQSYATPPAPAYAPSPPAAGPAYVPPAAAEPPARARRGASAVVSGLLGGLIGAALVGGAVYLYPPTRTVVTTRTTAPKPSTVTIATDASSQPVEAVAFKVTPSVVNVAISRAVTNPYTGSRVTQVVGNGSGVIIRADGYILTNDHVVEGADSLTVRLGTEDVAAKVVGKDPTTDLAVIKVAKTGLTAAEIGNSSALKVGETVIAVGSPFGLDKTVTTGIVSALHRSNLSASEGGNLTRYTNLIQTDASINPGNSGGALCDLRGRLIGINTLIQSTSGASAGIGFAIPIDFAKGVADQLIATGTAQHPYMGVVMATLDETVLGQLKLPADTTGALIQSVVAGSPAAKAGIRDNDIIVSIGGDAVATVEDAFSAIRSRKVAETVEVTVLRGGERVNVKVTLGSDAAK